MKTLLHLGAGYQHAPVEFYPAGEWREIRIDGDPDTGVEIVADIRQVPLPDGHADAIYCAHVLEHLPETDLPRVFGEFRRLLKEDGELRLIVPDIEIAARWIAEGRGNYIMYHSDAGPVRPLDVIYGFASAVGDRPLMSHRTGFTSGTLTWWLQHFAFSGVLYRTEDAQSLGAQTHKCAVNGQEQEYLRRSSVTHTILVQGDSTMESHPETPDEQPQPQPEPEPQPEQPQDGIASTARVSEHVSVGIVG